MNNPDDQDYETWSLDVWLPEDIEQLLRSRDKRCAEIDGLRAELAAVVAEAMQRENSALVEIIRLRAELAEQRRSERFLREHSAMVEANEALRAELAAAKHQAWADKYCLDADTRAIDLLRTELARAEEVNRAWAAENTWLSATLARVRELVRGRWVSVDDLQSALDGNQP